MVIQTFRYSDDWYDMTDGPGFSLTASDLIGVSASAWAQKAAWRPSAMPGGSPGFDDSLEIPALGTIVINELLANSAGGVPDWIELHNTGDRAVDVGGWFLSDDRDVPAKYEIAPATVIAAGGYLVLSEDLHFGNDNNAGSSETFGLSRN
ncbi:MAG: lamin tail domain-containing protein, partial [Planctomycetota bacterium]